MSVCCKVLEGDNERLIDANPRKFYMPAYIGAREDGSRCGWTVRRWTGGEVQELMRGSYEQMAPKKLVRQLEA